MDYNDYLSLADRLYAKASWINATLLNKSKSPQRNEGDIFMDVMMTQLTSHAMGFIKNYRFNMYASPGTALDIRCIIETLALMSMRKAGDINDDSIRLLPYQCAIFERNMYLKYPFIYKTLLDDGKLTRDYNDAVKRFSESCSILDISIKQVLKSRLPFLRNPSISFDEIINMYMSEKILDLYHLASLALHPHDNTNLDAGILVYSYGFIFETLKSTLSNVPFHQKYSFQSEMHRLALPQSIVNLAWLRIAMDQLEILKTIADAFHTEFDRNYPSNTLVELGWLLADINTDVMFGLCEQVKIKWKPFIELFSAFDRVYFDIESQGELYKLLNEHSFYMQSINTNKGWSYSLDRAYQIYLSLYPHGIAREFFDKKFIGLLGFLLDESGNIPSTSSLVFGCIEKYVRDEKSQEGIPVREILKTLYDESQLMSHSSGYMYYSNKGAFCDDFWTINSIDNLIAGLLEKMLSLFQLADEDAEETKGNIAITSALGVGVKNYRETLKRKSRLMEIPRISKSTAL